MAPKQQKFTARDIVTPRMSPAARRVFKQVLRDAAKDQEALLKKAAKIK